jgi:hypothetical protein
MCQVQTESHLGQDIEDGQADILEACALLGVEVAGRLCAGISRLSHGDQLALADDIVREVAGVLPTLEGTLLDAV